MIRLSAAPHRLHFRKPAATSRGALRTRDLWLIEARSDDQPDVVGRGETGVVPGLSVDNLPGQLEPVLDTINRARLVLPARSGEPLADVTALLDPFGELLAPVPALQFGIECALLDLLQGGSGLLFDTPFTRGEASLPTHGLIWANSPAEMLGQVRAKVAAGFDVIKMKVGTHPWPVELALLAEIRGEYPDIELRLDANCAFDEETIFTHLDAMAELRVAFLEEPVRLLDRSRAAQLCAASPVPLGLDEMLLSVAATRDYAALLAEVRPAHVILKPSLLGGLAQTKEIIALCDELGTVWWINSLLESAVGHSAICQFTAALGDKRTHGLGTGNLFADNFASPIAVRGARLYWGETVD